MIRMSYRKKIQQNNMFENIYMFYFVSNEGDDDVQVKAARPFFNTTGAFSRKRKKIEREGVGEREKLSLRSAGWSQPSVTIDFSLAGTSDNWAEPCSLCQTPSTTPKPDLQGPTPAGWNNCVFAGIQEQLEKKREKKKIEKTTNPCAHTPGGGEKRLGEGREPDGTFNSGKKLI